MRVVLFGASGMVGQAALRACLADPDVTEVASIVRTATATATAGAAAPHAKLIEIVHADFQDFSALGAKLAGDACLFCLGVSSAGMTEAAYRKITYDITLAAARELAKHSPDAAFIYVSGTGTDSTEKGRTMWARVKGATENALLALFPRAYMFRPGYIHPKHGIKSRTPWARRLYIAATPFYPLLRLWRAVVNTDELSAAMLNVAKRGAPAHVIEARDIRGLAQPSR